MEKIEKKKGISTRHNPSVISKTEIAGITLIALVITIIILLILAGVSIAMIGENGLISRAKESAFKAKMSAYKEEADMYVAWQITETMKTDTKWINSGDTLKEAIEAQVVMDIQKDDVTIEIKDIMKDISKKEEEYIVVYKGEMYYVSNSEIENNEKQEKWCREIGIPILGYVAQEGIVVRNGNYEEVNGVYLCTPKLDEGFDEEKTRYLEVDEEGDLVPGNWIKDKPTEKWYSYKESNWANIYVENSGADVYYVWIPRYCFTLNQSDQTSDVKFIDTDNHYKDVDGTEKTWEELQSEGYQVPEAFTFNNQELPGYWAMKYTAGDIITPSTINYDMSVVQGVITIKNITLNTTITNANPITKYTIALNGEIVEEITEEEKIADIKSQVIKIENLKQGKNTINVTGLNEAGEIVGSMTKEYEPAIVNKPDFTGFDENTTFYVTYDENENEHSTIPIKEEMPKYWYEYGESRWANIVTRNNGLETYYVWIPRYEFKLDQTNQRSIVQFINGTSTETHDGYQIPEAFTFNEKQLSGYWAMKYTAGTESAPLFDTEVTATSNSIKTKGITGTGVKEEEGQVYNYYINGESKGHTTNATDTFEYSGLVPNTKYTILVEIRNTNNEYVGSIVKQISTIDANKPEFIGFKEENTYYVLYDDEGNETIGDKIKKDKDGNATNMPANWYNYSERKWANIVVTDGQIVEGKIQNATKTTYFVWIPRYEFMITSSQQAQPAQGRTEVRFLSGTSTDTDIGYQIPEAFTFNEKQLTGYWAMKYTAGDM